MKKSLLILGLMTLFACNRESENLGVTELSDSSSKAASHRSGDIGAMSIDFLPHNLACELGQQIQPINTLPDPFSILNTRMKVKAQYQPFVASNSVISLPEFIVNYLTYQGIDIEEVLLDKRLPAGSYFENNFYKEYTFIDARTTVPDPDLPPYGFRILTFDDYMENIYASMIVQNAYAKIIPQVRNNSIKAIRIFYEDTNCPDLQEERRNLKIQVIYRVNFATQTPVLEL